jgi:hypothetical protein
LAVGKGPALLKRLPNLTPNPNTPSMPWYASEGVFDDLHLLVELSSMFS